MNEHHQNRLKMLDFFDGHFRLPKIYAFRDDLNMTVWIMFFRLGWTTLTIIWPGCLLQVGVLQICRIVDVLSHTKGCKWVKVSQSESKWVKVTGLVSDLFAPLSFSSVQPRGWICFYLASSRQIFVGLMVNPPTPGAPNGGVVLLWGWILKIWFV